MKGISSGLLSLVPMRQFGDPGLPRRSILDGQRLEPGDPAIYAITDFKRDYPMTVEAERQIDDALTDMIRLGVRALLVAKDQRLVGLLTSYDIQGERPMQFLQASNYSRHQDIRVFEQRNLTHLLVIEIDRKTSHSVVRALASRSRLLRQLAGAGSASLEPGHRADAREGHQQRADKVRSDRH
jgi:signal-transduction protein with cAMP-binding, CBS, and nucleotidyltransferase domain